MTIDAIYDLAVEDFCHALDACNGQILLAGEKLTGAQWLARFQEQK